MCLGLLLVKSAGGSNVLPLMWRESLERGKILNVLNCPLRFFFNSVRKMSLTILCVPEENICLPYLRIETRLAKQFVNISYETGDAF